MRLVVEGVEDRKGDPHRGRHARDRVGGKEHVRVLGEHADQRGRRGQQRPEEDEQLVLLLVVRGNAQRQAAEELRGTVHAHDHPGKGGRDVQPQQIRRHVGIVDVLRKPVEERDEVEEEPLPFQIRHFTFPRKKRSQKKPKPAKGNFGRLRKKTELQANLSRIGLVVLGGVLELLVPGEVTVLLGARVLLGPVDEILPHGVGPLGVDLRGGVDLLAGAGNRRCRGRGSSPRRRRLLPPGERG